MRWIRQSCQVTPSFQDNYIAADVLKIILAKEGKLETNRSAMLDPATAAPNEKKFTTGGTCGHEGGFAH